MSSPRKKSLKERVCRILPTRRTSSVTATFAPTSRLTIQDQTELVANDLLAGALLTLPPSNLGDCPRTCLPRRVPWPPGAVFFLLATLKAPPKSSREWHSKLVAFGLSLLKGEIGQARRGAMKEVRTNTTQECPLLPAMGCPPKKLLGSLCPNDLRTIGVNLRTRRTRNKSLEDRKQVEKQKPGTTCHEPPVKQRPWR